MEEEVTPKNFGRIAAQNAKQVIVQRIREAERGMVYEKYSDRENDIVTGTIQRIEGRNIFVDLGTAEGTLLPNEQIPGKPMNTISGSNVMWSKSKRRPRGRKLSCHGPILVF